MNYNLDYDLRKLKKKSLRDYRLAEEHLNIHAYCNKHDYCTYQVLQREGVFPIRYEVVFHVKSIVGINRDRSPTFGNTHAADIQLPARYPIEPVRCIMKTDLWHPNVVYHSERNKGHICINSGALGTWLTMDLLLKVLYEIISWKNFHAELTEPYPDDLLVAEWVREYAIPHGLVTKPFEGGLRDDFVPPLGAALPERFPGTIVDPPINENSRRRITIGSRKPTEPVPNQTLASSGGKLGLIIRKR